LLHRDQRAQRLHEDVQSGSLAPVFGAPLTLFMCWVGRSPWTAADAPVGPSPLTRVARSRTRAPAPLVILGLLGGKFELGLFPAAVTLQLFELPLNYSIVGFDLQRFFQVGDGRSIIILA